MSPNDLQRLLPRHFKIIELALDGNDRQTIAQVLEISPQTVSNVLNTPLVQDELSKRRANVTKKVDEGRVAVAMEARRVIEDSAVQAALVHKEIVTKTIVDDSGSEVPFYPAPVRQSSAEAILDRIFERNGQQKGVTVIEIDSLNLLNVALSESEGLRKEPPVTILDVSEEKEPISVPNGA